MSHEKITHGYGNPPKAESSWLQLHCSPQMEMQVSQQRGQAPGLQGALPVPQTALLVAQWVGKEDAGGAVVGTCGAAWHGSYVSSQ
jgi:hypothetical protein